VKKDLKVKKLRLSRETLKNLEKTELQVAVGGAASVPCTKKPLCTMSCGRPTCTC
jgi:hypothetical protein